MKSFTISKRVEFRWKVLDYYLTKDSLLINPQTGRIKQRTIKNSTIGYWIGRKFYSLAQINSMAEKIPKINLPF